MGAATSSFIDSATALLSSGGGGGAVDSVFGRTGSVVAVTGDYLISQIGGAGTAAAENLSAIIIDDGAGALTIGPGQITAAMLAAGVGSPGGSINEMQINDGMGGFAGSGALWDQNSALLTLNGQLTITGTINDASTAISIKPTDRILYSNGVNVFDWTSQTSNINGAAYWINSNAGNALVGSGELLTGVYADRATYLDGGGAFGTFGSTLSPDRWSPTAADQAISSFSQSTYFNDSGFYGNGSNITGVTITPPGFDGDFLVNVSGAFGTVGVSWNFPNSSMMIAGSLNLNGYIVDVSTNHSIDPNSRLLIASDSSTNMVDYTNASSNTSSAQVWFDSGNSNRLTTTDINLTGSLYTNGTRAVADGTYSPVTSITIVGGVITAIS